MFLKASAQVCVPGSCPWPPPSPTAVPSGQWGSGSSSSMWTPSTWNDAVSPRPCYGVPIAIDPKLHKKGQGWVSGYSPRSILKNNNDILPQPHVNHLNPRWFTRLACCLLVTHSCIKLFDVCKSMKNGDAYNNYHVYLLTWYFMDMSKSWLSQETRYSCPQIVLLAKISPGSVTWAGTILSSFWPLQPPDYLVPRKAFRFFLPSSNITIVIISPFLVAIFF